MSRTSMATPCPAPYSLSGIKPRRMSTVPTDGPQDETAELEYTRAIPQEIHNARPTRKSTFQRRAKHDAPITIFEDVVEDQELVVEPKREFGGSTLLGRAARRVPRGAASRLQEKAIEEESAQDQAGSKRRVSSLADSIPGLRFKTSEPVKDAPQESRSQGGLKKDPRRRTIFVPDDTTMLTIHPGAQNSIRLDDTFQLPSLPSPKHKDAPSVVRDFVPSKPKARSRMSLTVAPKRLPLQSTATKQGNVPAIDVAGQNGGKENLPPNHTTHMQEKKPLATHQVPATKPSINGSRLYAPTAASHARQSMHPRKAVALPKSSGTAPVSKPKPRPASYVQDASPKNARAGIHPLWKRTVATQRTTTPKSSPIPADTQSSPRPTKRKSPGYRPRSIDLKSARLQKYPVLSEDLEQPSLYENSWLSHQEVALSEVINQIFAYAQPPKHEWQDGDATLRARMVEIYHQPHVATMKQRLEASLLYGALSRPKDVPGPVLPAHDTGLRKRFLSLWLDSYNEEELRTAAEVVVGRQLPRSSSLSGGRLGEGILDPHKSRRALIGFLETFMVQVDDAEDMADHNERWRRMVLRSFMLIWLLDQVKVLNTTSRCLFKKPSPRKSSAQMLQALTTLVIPSIGDITRILRHLDFEVTYVQDPLDEVKYRIDNIATDLRDGVFLTRLVELLLFSPQNIAIKGASDDATVTIQLPDLTVLESAMYSFDGERSLRMLSRHLKMPCLGKAQKVFNVQLAISAVAEHGRLDNGSLDVAAEDIVNGHREKTLSLLWSLVSAYGLDVLVHFNELERDLNSHRPAAFDHGREEDRRYLSQHEQENLLHSWASVYCKKQGFDVPNLTTSFADNRAYAAIVNSFAGFTHALEEPTSSSKRLESCLRALGCSTAFIKNLTSTNEAIPTRQTTISNLAFLASRLLPLAKRHNAATVIQRAYRVKRSWVIASQRIALMRVAHACATVVQTQNRLIGAATVLQRAWRSVVSARVERVNKDVLKFQASARGWARRKSMLSERRGFKDGNASVRVMGGW